jgi:hypothetical protein
VEYNWVHFFTAATKRPIVPAPGDYDWWNEWEGKPKYCDLDTWRGVVRLTPRPLYLRGKSPRYPSDRRLGGPQSRSGRRGEMKILAPIWNLTPTPCSSRLDQAEYPKKMRQILTEPGGLCSLTVCGRLAGPVLVCCSILVSL